MREIILDTETTGFDPKNGDRIVEIGAMELVNRFLSDNNFHIYINPERSMPQAAFAVHGLGDNFLKDKPLFAEIVDSFLEFVGQDQLVIHNASFDIGFLNAELERLNKPTISMSRVVDTLALARRKHPGASNSLDALCKRYKIDNSNRALHGALLDSELLSQVYIELIGGKQAGFDLNTANQSETATDDSAAAADLQDRKPRPIIEASPEERALHKSYIDSFPKAALWTKNQK